MLKARIITGLILASLVLAGLFWLNTAGVAALLAVVIAIGAFEWAGLCAVQGARRVLYVLFILGLCGLSVFLPVRAVLIPGVVWWVYAMWDLVVRADGRTGLWRHPGTELLIGVLVLVPAWRACVALKAWNPARPEWLFMLLFLVWAADTVAYFVGRAFGRRRLAPKVSPGKTIEGAAGGLAGAALLVFAWTMAAGYSGGMAVRTAAFAALVAAFSVAGDLVESKGKRLRGVKDSGRLLPGHGGMLDRIDALTAAAPVFVLGIRWLVGDRS